MALCAGSAQAAVIQPPLRVDGTVLRDQTGNRVGLVGVSVQMVPFYSGSTPTTQDSFLADVADRNFAQRDAEFAAIRSLGYDAIRVHIPDPALYNSQLYESKSSSVARIQSIVNSAKAHGLVTILDANAIGDNMADWRTYEPMFADLIASIGNDPWVIWEPFNEPADYSPGAPLYLAAVEGIGAYLRSLGSLQPLIIPSDGYEQNVVPSLMNSILANVASQGWRGAGVLFGVHVYFDQYMGAPTYHGDSFTGVAYNTLQDKVADNLSSYPLIVTEMGRYNNGITMTDATLSAYQWTAGLGPSGLNGLIAWDWDWALNQQASDPNAWTWDGLHLNPWGQESNGAVDKMAFPPMSAAKPPTTSPGAPLPQPTPPSKKSARGARPSGPWNPIRNSRAPLELGKAKIAGATLRVVVRRRRIEAGSQVRLTLWHKSSGRVVKASRTITVRSARRVIRWKLPRALIGARSLTLRATYSVQGQRCNKQAGGCWRALTVRHLRTHHGRARRR